MMRGCGRAAVFDQHCGRMLLQELRVPEMPRRQSLDLDLAREAIARIAAYRVEKRRPEGLRLCLCEALERQGNLEHVVATEHELLPPMRTEQAVAVKRDCLGNEPAVGRVGAGRNGA